MPYGPLPPRKLPKQDADLAHLIADRFNTASIAHHRWAKKAKECTDFLEDRQWSDADRAQIEGEGRVPATLNKIKPIFTLAMGFQADHPIDIDFLPGHDGSGPEAVARVLQQINKQVDEANSTKYVDAEVVGDGFTTGRGWWDTRLSFTRNDLGEIVERSCDPFSTYIDPDCLSYDINGGLDGVGGANYVAESRWVSLDEIRMEFGQRAYGYLAPIFGGQRVVGMPMSMIDYEEEIAPPRGFGGEWGKDAPFYSEIFFDYVDQTRKTVRLIDMQHRERVKRRYFLDLGTGDRVPIPDVAGWRGQAGQIKIEKVLAWAQMRGTQMDIVERTGWRIRWTIMAADTILYHEWSPYERYTKTLYSPYFRRGETLGMIHSLIDPQKFINKSATAELNMLSRAGNTGWEFETGSLTPDNEENLRENGSAAGFVLEYDTKEKKLNKPERIEAAHPPTGWSQQRAKSEVDLRTISLMNESAQGIPENAKSGRAIQARQRQALIGLSPALQNLARSKELIGTSRLSIVQRHYTERRVFVIRGDDGRLSRTMINDRQATGEILNNVNSGRYQVIVDTRPASASFMEAQFEEAMELLQKGIITPAEADLIIDLSNMPRKEEFKERVQARLAAQGIPVQAGQDGMPMMPQQQQPGLPAPGGAPVAAQAGR